MNRNLAAALIAGAALLAACGQQKQPTLFDLQAQAAGTFPQGKILHLTGHIEEKSYAGTFEWRAMKGVTAQEPGAVRVTLTISPETIYEEGFDGKAAWEKPVGETKGHPTPGEPETALRRGAITLGHYRTLNELIALGLAAAILPRETVEGVEYDVVEMTFPDGYAERLYLDMKTHLIARTRVRKALHVGIDTTRRNTESVLSDYRKVDGVTIAFLMTERDVDTGETTQTITWQSAEFTPADPAVFAAP